MPLRRHLFVSPSVNLVLGVIYLAIALSGRFLFGNGSDTAGYIFSGNGAVSVIIMFTVLPTLLYRHFAEDYEGASPKKTMMINKFVLFMAFWSIAIIGLFLTNSEFAKFASLGYLGLCVVGLIRLIAIVRRKETA